MNELKQQLLAEFELIQSHSKYLEDLRYLEKNAHRYDSIEELIKDFPSYWDDDVEVIANDLRKNNEKLRELGVGWYEEYKNLKNFLSQAITTAYETGLEEGQKSPTNEVSYRVGYEESREDTQREIVRQMLDELPEWGFSEIKKIEDFINQWRRQ